MRLIDADTLLVRENCHNMYPSIDHYCLSQKVIRIEDIMAAPTVDPVRHGHWIEDGDSDGCGCSICGHEYCYLLPDKDILKFCPNCGAKMDIEVEYV